MLFLVNEFRCSLFSVASLLVQTGVSVLVLCAGFVLSHFILANFGAVATLPITMEGVIELSWFGALSVVLGIGFKYLFLLSRHD